MKSIALGILNYSNLKDHVIRDLHWALNNRNLINREPFPREILGYLIEVIVTQGYWRLWFKQQLINKLRNQGLVLYNDEIIVGVDDYNKLLQVVAELAEETGKPYWKKILDSLNALYEGLIRAGSLKVWIDTLYRLVSTGDNWKKHEYFRGIKGLGTKSVEMILRDMGHFDRVPIDRHERRFLLRTGIALVYGPPSKDPASPEFYSEALTNYCRENLNDVSLEGIPLGSAPGILDWAIWYFSCERESRDCKAICSSNPQCGICPIRDTCLYWRMHHTRYE